MSLWTRVRNVFRSEAVNEDIAEELESHVREGVAAGRDARDVRRAMGNAAYAQEASHEARVIGWMDSLRSDVIFGLRQLMKRKVTTGVAVLSLALAMGSCMAAYRLIDAIFLRSLPVDDPQHLYVASFIGMLRLGQVTTWNSISYPMFQQMRDAVQGQATLAAIGYTSRNDITYGGYQQTEQAYQNPVSGEAFSMLGLKPALGRLINAQDDRAPKQSPVAVLSYDYWQRRFHGDPQVLGKRFHKGDDVFEIVGVMQKGYTGTEPGAVADIFTPTMMEGYVTDKNDFDLTLYLRPANGTNVSALQSKLDAVYQHSEKERAKTFNDLPPEQMKNYPNANLFLSPGGNGVSGLKEGYRTPMWALSVVIALVLLIACANVANLMSAQSAARAREMAVRVSLGAGRARLVRLVLVESTMLGAAASVLGLMFAWWAAPFVVSRMTPVDWPIRLVLPMDWGFAAFGLVLLTLVLLLFGLLPALRASLVQPSKALKGSDEPKSMRSTMHGLIAAQVAFCFVVLFVAGLFTATFARLQAIPLGFSSDQQLILETTAQQPVPLARWNALMDALRAVPGVHRVAMADRTLLGGMNHNESVIVDGVKHTELLAYFVSLTPGWIDVMHVPLLAGRDIRDSDMHDSTALVNQTFAKTYFAGKDPVGRSFMLLDGKTPITIVGVVGDAVYKDIHQEMLAQIYQPMRTDDGKGGIKPLQNASVLVETSGGDPFALSETLQKVVVQTDANMRVSKVRSERNVVQGAVVRERILATLGGFFAVVALLLATLGLYGVLHYSVVQREREIGVRIALGAAASNIARVVSVRVFGMVLLGTVIGVGLGMVSQRYIASLLYNVKGTDPTTMLLPAAVLLCAAIGAAVPPVLRAVRVNPVIMLRSE